MTKFYDEKFDLDLRLSHDYNRTDITEDELSNCGETEDWDEMRDAYNIEGIGCKKLLEWALNEWKEYEDQATIDSQNIFPDSVPNEIRTYGNRTVEYTLTER